MDEPVVTVTGELISITADCRRRKRYDARFSEASRSVRIWRIAASSRSEAVACADGSLR